MADYDTTALLSADRAYWVSTDDTPLNDQAACVRKWDKLPKGALDECRTALLAVSSYSSPQAGNKTVSGTWRNSGVEVAEGAEYGTITQTLQYGFATTALPTAQVVEGQDLKLTPFADDDIVDRYDRVYQYRGIDPSKYDSLRPSIGTDTDGYTTVDVRHQENRDGSIDIFERRRKFVIAEQTVTSGETTKRVALAQPGFTASGYSIRYHDVDKDDLTAALAALDDPPSGYAVDRVVVDHDRDSGTATLTQVLENTQDWEDDILTGEGEEATHVGTGVTLRKLQPGVDAEIIDVVWHRVKKEDLSTALAALDDTAAIAGYVVVECSHNDNGGPYADVTQRLRKISSETYTVRTDYSGEAGEVRTYILPNRDTSAEDPSAPAPPGFTLRSTEERQFDETASTWVFVYDKTHTMDAGTHQAASFLVARQYVGEEAERHTRKYFGVESADSTDALFTTPTADYQVVGIVLDENGRGYADVTVTEVKAYAAADAPVHIISQDNPDANAEVRIRRYLNVQDADITAATFTTPTAGYHIIKIDAPKDGSGIGDVVVTEVKTGSDVDTDKYTVAERYNLDETAETYTEVFARWASDPEDDGSWAAPTNYSLIDKTTTERGEGLADYTFEWGRSEAAVSPGEEEDYTDYGEVISEDRPLDPNGGTITRIYRNQSWTNAKALVQTLKAEANTLRAVARPKPGQRADVYWEYRDQPGSAYTVTEYATRYRSVQEPTLSGNEVTKWVKKRIQEDITIARTYTFYVSVAAAETAASTNASSLNPGERERVFPLPDGTAYIEKVDIGDSRTSATTLWEVTV